MALGAKQSHESIIFECSGSEDNAEVTEYPANPLRFDDEHVYAVVVLGEDLVMEATIDTGSAKSLISEYFANELRNGGNITKVRNLIKLADDSTVIAEEALEIVVRLGNCCARTKLLILPQVRDEIILGIDFLCGVDTNLQLCGEVIQLQHMKTMKEKDENESTNINAIGNKCDIVMKENSPTTLALLSKANHDKNISAQAINKSFERNVKKTATSISTSNTGVTICEDELHSLPLILQQDIAKMKHGHPGTHLNFERILDEQHFTITIERNGTVKVKICNASQQQQSDNGQILINARPVQSTIDGLICSPSTTHRHMLSKEVLSQSAKQQPFIPVECPPRPLVASIHMPLLLTDHKHNTEENEPSRKIKIPYTPPAGFLTKATMLSSSISEVCPSTPIGTSSVSAVDKPQMSHQTNHTSETDEGQLKSLKRKRGGKLVKMKQRLSELKNLIPLAYGYNKQRLLAEETRIKNERIQRKRGKQVAEPEKEETKRDKQPVCSLNEKFI